MSSPDRLRAAHRLASDQGGVAGRRQLYDLGLTRGEVRAHVRAGRWQRTGSQTLALHNGEVSRTGHLWAAVLEGGPRAMIDGAAALVAGGLERFDVARIRVTVPRGARVRRHRLYDIRQSRRWAATDAAPSGIPRARPAIAAVRGALWAQTDKAAAYLLTRTVQDGLARPEDLGRELLRIKRDRRRHLLHLLVNDLLEGGRTLDEIDVVRELRRRGLPAPAQQVLRRDRRNRYYLDLYWPDLGVVVEIDGIHHTWANNVVGDALRQNALALEGDIVLRLPLLGLRLQPEDFFAQIESALKRGRVTAA